LAAIRGKKMAKKIILIIFLFNTVGITTSCFDQCDNYKYYDFDQISIVPINSVVALADSLTLRIDKPDGRFVASNDIQSHIMTIANATIDCDKGWGGLKFPINKIEVTSDSDFNADFPANTVLNEIIMMRKWTKDNDFELTSINNIDNGQDWTWMFIKERPTLSKSHKLTIKLFKSNGDIIIGTSDLIEWD
jgi:hypothetical protein